MVGSQVRFAEIIITSRLATQSMNLPTVMLSLKPGLGFASNETVSMLNDMRSQLWP